MFYSRVKRGTVSECNDPGMSAGPLDWESSKPTFRLQCLPQLMCNNAFPISLGVSFA